MKAGAIKLDDLPPEAKQEIRKRIRPDRDSLARAAVAVLAALDQTSIEVKQWPKVLELVRKWLKA